MSLAQTFDTKVSNADFLSADWRLEHCDPENWEKPSTHGIEGVELVGEPHMKLWSETKGWTNPGRKNFLQKSVIHLSDKIETEGIIPSRVVYYDVDTNETNNGAHRRGVSEIRSIPGWMHQGLRFKNELAKIRFANASNHVEGLIHNEPTKDDVKEGVRAVLKQLVEFDKKTIRNEVRIQGPGLTDKQKDDIVNVLYSDCMFDGNMKSSSRYRDFNNNNVEALLKIIRKEHSEEEPWVTNYFDNDDEVTIIINVANIESRVGSILTHSARAVSSDTPLHILFVVPVPVGKETLESKREKFFSTHMSWVEERLLDIQGKSYTDKNRRDFPWNHPDCQHRTVAQDTENEPNIPLIKVRNRDFN